MSMAAYCQGQDLPGFSHWFKVQAQEEMTHGLRLFDYLHERGGKVTMKAIKAPETSWPSPLACLRAVQKHEAMVTGLIHKLVSLARQNEDYASENFLQWFVKEQIEEEASVAAVLGKLRLAGESAGALFMLDKDMAARVFAMPVDLTI